MPNADLAMTDEEFERLKEAEKKHLREKRQMRRTLKALKRRNQAQSLVQKMRRGAERLLRETESLVDTLRTQMARDEAEFEVAVEDTESVDDLHDAEEALREERAEALVRQYKTAARPSGGDTQEAEPGEDDASTSDAETSSDGPDKTIGRMRNPRSDDTA